MTGKTIDGKKIGSVSYTHLDVYKRQEWYRVVHVERKDPTRFSRRALDCHPNGKRSVGRHGKRWLDDFHLGWNRLLA